MEKWSTGLPVDAFTKFLQDRSNRNVGRLVIEQFAVENCPFIDIYFHDSPVKNGAFPVRKLWKIPKEYSKSDRYHGIYGLVQSDCVYNPWVKKRPDPPDQIHPENTIKSILDNLRILDSHSVKGIIGLGLFWYEGFILSPQIQLLDPNTSKYHKQDLATAPPPLLLAAVHPPVIAGPSS